ncbi:hypothetical protein RN001_005346 [Aquatica leii]|uniref:THAP-type domain-containing protein n=1 Tax=Aquatica leii TaxID=1421715 RepID=A0AAN7PBT6_9COLE|nr:hypothetical protein RN001_005346 [Aquatica leii]
MGDGEHVNPCIRSLSNPTPRSPTPTAISIKNIKQAITPGRRRTWMIALKRDANDKMHKDACVCSKHFLPEDFKIEGNKRSLKENVIPTINLRPAAKIQLFSEYKRSSTTVKSLDETSSPLALSVVDADLSVKSAFAIPSTSSLNNLNEKCIWPVMNSKDTTTDSDSSKNADIELLSVSSGKKRKMELTSTDSEGLKGSPKKRRSLLRTFHNYCKSPRKLNRSLLESKQFNSAIRANLKTEKAKVKRLKRRICNLSDIVTELKKLRLISGDARLVLEKCYSGIPLAMMKPKKKTYGVDEAKNEG